MKKLDEIRMTEAQWRACLKARLPRLRGGYLPVSLNPSAKPRAVALYRARQRRQLRSR